jgi:2-C-methyl-D-erythritol 4-phosphate cytidylyltransferase
MKKTKRSMAPEPAPDDTRCAGAILLAVGGADSPDGDGFNPFWASLGGIPLLTWSVTAFERAPEIAETALVVAPDRLSDATTLAAAQGWQRTRPVAVSNSRLHDTLRRALDSLAPDISWIVIHDAARPLVTPELISAGLATVGALPAAPVADNVDIVGASGGRPSVAPAVVVAASISINETLKRVQGGLVVETPARAQLALLQTPQAFSRSALLAALDAAPADLDPPDAASLAVAAGLRVALFPGSPTNIRVAIPADLALAEAILNSR